jgi:prepilin-type N-terminal cleavage/methylation domain-containing protein
MKISCPRRPVIFMPIGGIEMRTNNKHSRTRKGFTLVEVTVVLVIVSILAAIAAPSIFAFLQRGQQVNRDNIARTLYLAAQSQLTRMRITGGLSDGLIEEDFVYNGNGRTGLIEPSQEDIDEDHVDNVRFIRKAANTPPAGLLNDILAPVIVNKEILNDAILIEFNVRTGVVLSVFYGDAGQDLFDYIGDDSREDVVGNRGMGAGGYEVGNRRQGYYGVTSTGQLGEEFEYLYRIIFDIFDGADRPLDDVGENVLYVDVLIEKDKVTGDAFTLTVIGTSITTGSVLFSELGTMPNGLYKIENPDYYHIIWIIDHLGVDEDNNIASIRDDLDPNMNIRAYLEVEGFEDSETLEIRAKHPYYATSKEYNNNFQIVTARHLHNIRHLSDDDDATFSLMREILDLDPTNRPLNRVSNFVPIEDFTGTFNGNFHTIENLTVEDAPGDAGLFASVSGEVNNLTLLNPDITGNSNVGSVAGRINSGGTVSGVYVAYTEITRGITGNTNVGGIVGQCSGTIEDAVFVSPFDTVHISGSPGYTGGIAGSLYSTAIVDRVQFLALAPGDPDMIFPIAGYIHDDYIDDVLGDHLYYLLGDPVIPPSGEIDAYNMYIPYKDIGEGLSTLELYDLDLRSAGWRKNPGVTEFNFTETYPYHFLSNQRSFIDTLSTGDWPVTDFIPGDGKLIYYEIHQGNPDPLFYPDDFDLVPSETVIVVNDGYVLEISEFKPNNPNYSLLLGGTRYPLPGFGSSTTFSLAGSTWYTQVDNSDPDDIIARIFIPNRLLEDASGGANINVALELGSVRLFNTAPINPMFPPGSGVIRSPRHIKNISSNLSANYTQQLHLDFAAYRKERGGTSAMQFNAAVVDGIFTGDYNGGFKEIRNLTITGSATNVGLFATVGDGGRVENLIILNPDIEGNSNVGSVAGNINSGGTVSDVYVAYTDDNDSKRITGDFKGITGNTAGGIAGQCSGTIINAVFVSPHNTVHISGNPGYIGGIAGSLYGAASVDRVQFLALAPGTGNVNFPIAPIAGSISGASVSNAYYLYGMPVRPTTVIQDIYNLGQDIYNLGDAEAGDRLSTLELYELNIGWNRNTSPGVTSANYLSRYPYQFLPGQQSFVNRAASSWPVADDIKSIGTLMYYESYWDSPNPVFYTLNQPLPAGNNLSEVIVTHDGYALRIESLETTAEYSMTLGGQTFSLSGFSTAVPSLTVTGGGVNPWPAIYTNEDGDIYTTEANGDITLHLIIPNSFIEGLFINFINEPSNSDVVFSMSLIIDGKQIGSAAVNPMFPPNGLLRSPRHIDNIDKIDKNDSDPPKNYTQQLHVDFAAYRKNAAAAVGGALTVNTPLIYDNVADNKATVIEGGFTGVYNGNGREIRNLTITGLGDQIGLIDENSGTVHDLTLVNMKLSGGNDTGGIAGTNAGTISNITLIDSEVSGGNNTGGIAGTNAGTVENAIIRNTAVAGNSNTGGIAGTNSNTLKMCAAEFSVVGGTANVGGIAGSNSGTVKDTYILSTANVSAPPVTGTANTGGITGLNSGTVRLALCLAPAPVVGNSFHPIVGTGSDSADSFYLSGSRHRFRVGGSLGAWMTEGTFPDITHIGYNRRIFDIYQNIYSLQLSGGGIPLNTDFITLAWFTNMEQITFNTNVWQHATGMYPYPFFKERSIPTEWAFASNPDRPGQIEFDDWQSNDATVDRARAPDFVNGMFADNFLHRIEVDQFYNEAYIASAIASGNLPADYRVNVPNFRWMALNWFSIDMDSVNGWHTRPIPRNYTANNFFNANKPVVADGRNDYYFPHENGTFPRGVAPNNADSLARRVPLLTPAPAVNHIHNRATIANWSLIELQEANGSTDFMRTNYLGRSRANSTIHSGTPGTGTANTAADNHRYDRNRINNTVTASYGSNLTPGANRDFRYAELNAQIEGTLYQVLPSTPGVQFFYSFYHATNGFPTHSTANSYPVPPAHGDRLNFFLSPYVAAENNPEVVRDAAHAGRRDAVLEMIRPAQSPRSAPTIGGTVHNGAQATLDGANAGVTATSNVILNPAAWNTVSYGASTQAAPTGSNSGGPYSLSYHNNRYYLQPDGNRVRQVIPAGTVYLYDVWIGETTTGTGNGGQRNGYGITFWSQTEITGIPVNGYAALAAAPAAARSNVIGYWDVSFGWKHFYGEYTVPDGQTQTEFAFQSASGPTRTDRGNYLDGVTFKAPAFLSITNNIVYRGTSADGMQDGTNARFVTPGRDLRVEMNVSSWGEVQPSGIEIINTLAPFDEYIEYIGNVRVTVGGNPVAAQSIQFNEAEQTLTVRMPSGFRLPNNQVLRVTFDIKVRQTIKSSPVNEDGISTLIYRFQNQAVVRYVNDSAQYPAYSSEIFQNASNMSPPFEVAINPVHCIKTVTPLIDGPFAVTLEVSGHLNAHGFISDTIPAGFEISSNGTLPFSSEPGEQNTAFTNEAGGQRNLTISNIDLKRNETGPESNHVFTYYLRYTGEGFGITFPDVGSSYQFRTEIEDGDGEFTYLTLRFAKPVIGIRPRPRDQIFALSGTQSVPLDFLSGVIDSNRALASDDYDISPTVIFTDAYGTPLPDSQFSLIGGNQRIENDLFTAALIRDVWNLEVTPKDGAKGSADLYFKILLNATRPGGASFNLDSRTIHVLIHVNMLCPECNNLEDDCECCPVCGEYDAGCGCCLVCGELEDDCECCPVCGEYDTGCGCCLVCGEYEDDCICCPVCGEFDTGCGCCLVCEEHEDDCVCICLDCYEYLVDCTCSLIASLEELENDSGGLDPYGIAAAVAGAVPPITFILIREWKPRKKRRGDPHVAN